MHYILLVFTPRHPRQCNLALFLNPGQESLKVSICSAVLLLETRSLNRMEFNQGDMSTSNGERY